MLYLFFIITIVYIFVNYLISDRDLFNPAVLFAGINFLSAFMCVILQKQYDIELHFNTFIVLFTGLLIFTVVNTLGKLVHKKKRSRGNAIQLQYIELSSKWIVLFIGLEIVVAYMLMQYVKSVASSYFGGSRSFLVQVAQYNTLAKFNSNALSELGIDMPAVVSHGSNLCKGVVFILIALEVNNFLVKKRFDKLIVIAIMIRAISSLFTGSRGDLFEYITAILIDSIILSRRKKGYYKKGDLKFLTKILLVSILIIAGIFLLSLAVGRAIKYDGAWYNTFFGYLGAPIVNLDTFLQTDFKLSTPFGRESFVYIYNYIGNTFNIAEYRYSPNLPFLYHNGIGTGNVYTMYFPLIEDFGYLGFIPFVIITAWYYIFTYHKIANVRSRKNPIGMSLFIYSYLFNPLIMLMFADRFFTSVTRLYSIRMFIWMIVFWLFFKKGYFTKGKRYFNDKTLIIDRMR